MTYHLHKYDVFWTPYRVTCNGLYFGWYWTKRQAERAINKDIKRRKVVEEWVYECD